MADLYANPWGGSTDSLFPNMSLWDNLYEQEPNVGYRRYLNQAFGRPTGMGLNNFGRYANSQYGNLYADFTSSAQERGPDYTWMSYLKDNGMDLEKQFRGLNSRQRGENPGAYSGRVRWTGV